MPDPAPNPELLPSLGRLIRGLAALFWGLPIALIVCFHVGVSRGDALRQFGVLPPLAATGLLLFGLWQMSSFQPQERVWRSALDRARILGLVNLGLSPFLYWWNHAPDNGFFLVMLILLALGAWLFLGSLNLVLQRLGAMLPDEALRLEIKQFTFMNVSFLVANFVLALGWFVFSQVGAAPFSRTLAATNPAGVHTALDAFPIWMAWCLAGMQRSGGWIMWVLTLLFLTPFAMTMALLWKTKEVILHGVFRGR